VTLPIQTATGWAEEIRRSLGRSVEAIIDVGNTIKKCKAELPHGQFQEAVQLAGISPRVAQMFMAVADNPVLSNTSIYSQLPGAYNTLYALSRLDVPQLEEAIGNGTVSAVMTLAEAKTLASHEPKTWEASMHAFLESLNEAYAGVDEIADGDPNEALQILEEIITLAGKAQNMAAAYKLKAEREAGLILAADQSPELMDLMEHEKVIEAGLAEIERLGLTLDEVSDYMVSTTQ
jgi:hypothetical protein